MRTWLHEEKRSRRESCDERVAVRGLCFRPRPTALHTLSAGSTPYPRLDLRQGQGLIARSGFIAIREAMNFVVPYFEEGREEGNIDNLSQLVPDRTRSRDEQITDHSSSGDTDATLITQQPGCGLKCSCACPCPLTQLVGSSALKCAVFSPCRINAHPPLKGVPHKSRYPSATTRDNPGDYQPLSGISGLTPPSPSMRLKTDVTVDADIKTVVPPVYYYFQARVYFPPFPVHRLRNPRIIHQQRPSENMQALYQ